MNRSAVRIALLVLAALLVGSAGGWMARGDDGRSFETVLWAECPSPPEPVG